MDTSKIKIVISAVLAFAQCEIILAANPMNTITESTQGDASGGTGGSLWLLSPLITFPLAIWLVVSSRSPMYAWAEKNKGLAYLFVIFAPCIPALLFGLGR